MPLLKDRVKQTTTTTGTGSVALSGSVAGFQTFAQAFTSGASVYYCIADGTNWEVGIGTYTAGSPGSLSRDVILDSSNAKAAVSWGVGTKDVFVTLPAAAVPSGALSLPVTTTTVNYSATAADAGKVLKFSSAAMLTLPVASSLPAGWAILVSNRSSGSVTVAAGSGDTVNGQPSQPLRPFFDLLVYRNGSNSFEVAAFGSAATTSTTTWNPADIDSNMVLSNGNLTWACSGGGPGGMRAGRATTSISSGAYYYEFGTITPDGCQIGWGKSAARLDAFLGFDANSWGYGADGKRWTNNSGSAYGTTWGTGTHRIGCYAKSTATNVFDIWVSVDGIVQGGGDPIVGTGPMFSGITGPLFPMFGDNSATSVSSGTAYFAPTGWQTVPSVFNPLP